MSMPPAGVPLAPIALFVYNRPEHTQKTVDSLRQNDLASQSDLFVFSDGAKTDAGSAAVLQTRRYVRTIHGFKSVTVIDRDRNFGLAKSVIAGVTELCTNFGRVIAMEDDLLTTPDFLVFMNRALERYKTDSKIYSVSGFNFALNVPDRYGYDAFCSYRSSSWGWGTWNDRWQAADWGVSDYRSFQTDKDRRRLFDRGGEDLSRMLDLQMEGRIDSWAIRWAYTHFRNRGVALLPTATKVLNIGLDGSGVHCAAGSAKQSNLVFKTNREYRFPDSTEPDPDLAAELRRMCRSSLPRKVARYVLRKLRPPRVSSPSSPRASL